MGALRAAVGEEESAPQAPLLCELLPTRSLPLPTLFATRLRLELLLAERTVDLRDAAAVILDDPAATLAIFRKAGMESAAMLERVEDCLAVLSTESWMEAISECALERLLPEGPVLHEALALWEHSRSIAQYCWFAAEENEGLCPEQAYLVGLLHEAPRLVRLCDPAWADAAGRSEDSRLMRHCSLPPYLEWLFENSADQAWSETLATAHRWALTRERALLPAG